MKKISLMVVGLLSYGICIGQRSEWHLSLNSGLFSFGGASAQSTTSIFYTQSTNNGYTNNPYGSAGALSYGASLRYQRITARRVIFGLDAGHEVLQSQIAINQMYVLPTLYSSSFMSFEATGTTHLRYRFINVFPYAGYRLGASRLGVDLRAGLDLAHCLDAHEKGNATANGTHYRTSVDRTTIRTDVRPRIQVSVQYARVGLYVGYSQGLVNYLSGYVGGINQSYGRVVRFGLSYQVR